MVKDTKTLLFRNKALTMPFGFMNSKSKKNRIITFLDKKYDLIIVQ